jgi:hypothetical protein
MKLSREDVIRMAAEVASISETDLFGKANFVFNDSAVQRFAQLAYEAGAEAEREGCAVTAWQHYMDTCYRLRIPASNNEHFNAAAAIRSRGDI